MIDVHDLMVGNYVYDGDKTKFPMYICSVQCDGCVALDFKGNEGMPWEADAKDLEGIPLTEDLLKQIGFKYNDNGLWEKEEKKRDILINIGREFVFVEAFDKRMLDSRGWCHGIKYLHQLQNFFRNISKESLETNL